MVPVDSSPALKVALIEDSTLLQQALGGMLREMERVELVGGASDEHSALELLQRQRPHLAIIDLQLRTGSGLGVLRALCGDPERFGRPLAVVYSHHGRGSVRELCFALGVQRVFDKATQTNELLAYVRDLMP